MLNNIIDWVQNLFRQKGGHILSDHIGVLSEQKRKTWTVMVADNFHYMDQSEVWKRGEFESYDLALTVCMEMVDASLYEYLPKSNSVEELYDYYKSFGDDPYIIPSDTENGFSAWTYAKTRCVELIQNK